MRTVGVAKTKFSEKRVVRPMTTVLCASREKQRCYLGSWDGQCELHSYLPLRALKLLRMCGSKRNLLFCAAQEEGGKNECIVGLLKAY